MCEFVILFHQMPELAERKDHWDLMIQYHDSLITWALDSAPVAGADITAVRLADHRLEYLKFQGPLSAGRGEVTQVAKGNCKWLDHTKTGKMIQLFGPDFVWRVTVTELTGQFASVGIVSCPDDRS